MLDFSQKMLVWYRHHKRDLPWRTTRDPYAIFMSELMLQQTQVDRVIPLWQSWIKTFPTWNDLAEAPTPTLLHAWAGLGYNRRALYAREAAQAVVKHGIPQQETDWRTLKGVGPYMAAALAAFISHQRTLVIDTNIRRVIGRVFLGIPFPSPLDDQALLPILESHLPQDGAHWDIPQAMMDLASSTCTNTKPACADCPLKDLCKARALFEKQPNLRKQKKISRESIREGKEFPDRIYRGRILTFIREHGPSLASHLGAHIDPSYSVHDQDWVLAMVRRMEKDGLVRLDKGRVSLAT